MMKNLKYLLIAFLPFLMAANCKKATLTPETQTGENTFSCKINGQVYVPYVSITTLGLSSISSAIKREYFASTIFNRYQFEKNAYCDLHLEVNNIPSIISGKSYTIEDSGFKPKFNKTIKLTDTSEKEIKYVFTKGYIIFTKFDTVAKIASGTFAFSGKDTVTNENLVVTDGRFDIKFVTIKD